MEIINYAEETILNDFSFIFFHNNSQVGCIFKAEIDLQNKNLIIDTTISLNKLNAGCATKSKEIKTIN